MGTPNSRISARIPDNLRVRLNRIHSTNRTDDSDFIRDAMHALADYVDQTGCYRVPIKVVFAGDTAEIEAKKIVAILKARDPKVREIKPGNAAPA